MGTGGGASGMTSLNRAGKQRAQTGQHVPVVCGLSLDVHGVVMLQAWLGLGLVVSLH